VTQGSGQGQGIAGEIGYAPAGSQDPQTDPTAWTWSSTLYNTSVDGEVPGDLANDEYMGSVNISTDGSWLIMYRFTADSGSNWTYCDLDGSDNGLDVDQSAQLFVYQTEPEFVDWCIFQYPESTTMTTDATSEMLYGRVYAMGITEGAGQGTGITAEIGYGNSGSNPQSHPSWTFVPAEYNVSVDGLVAGDLANDEYSGTITVLNTGTYSMVYRFSRDGGNNWTYCDTTGSDDGFDQADMASITVSN
ncbi:MAG: hypothetical protein ACQES9_00510, partial [Myxococcota bacterium]